MPEGKKKVDFYEYGGQRKKWLQLYSIIRVPHKDSAGLSEWLRSTAKVNDRIYRQYVGHCILYTEELNLEE